MKTSIRIQGQIWQPIFEVNHANGWRTIYARKGTAGKVRIRRGNKRIAVVEYAPGKRGPLNYFSHSYVSLPDDKRETAEAHYRMQSEKAIAHHNEELAIGITSKDLGFVLGEHVYKIAYSPDQRVTWKGNRQNGVPKHFAHVSQLQAWLQENNGKLAAVKQRDDWHIFDGDEHRYVEK